MARERRYWDTACFLAVLNREEGRVEVCEPILRAATHRSVEIVTSAFTITEVLLPKGGRPLSPAVPVLETDDAGLIRLSGLDPPDDG